MKEKEIVEILEQANLNYHNGKDSSLSDEEYDSLVEKLKKINPKHKLLKRVGAEALNHRSKVEHEYFMGSLKKVNSISELRNWIEKTYENPKTLKWNFLHKIDGVSISLQFVDGKVVKASTRGNGEIGEDVTLKFSNFQVKDNFTGYLFGEAFIYNFFHEQYFRTQSNPRNTVAGLVRSDKQKEDKYIWIYVFSGRDENGNLMNYDKISLLVERKNRMICGDYFSLSYDSLLEKVEEYISKNERLTKVFNWASDQERILTDGIVVSPFDEEESEKLGYTSGRPVGKIALKLPAESEITEIVNVTWQTGRTGRVTPVANFEPIEIGGVNVSNASLHNRSYIEALGGVRVGDMVSVSRRGDVIPYVEKVITRGDPTNTLETPDSCPSCGGKLVTSGEYTVCTNASSCPAQIEGRIQNYLQVLEVKGYGDVLVSALVEKGIHLPHQIYELENFSQMIVNDRQVGESGENAEKSLAEKSQGVKLERLLAALGVPGWGESLFKTLLKGNEIKTVEEFLEKDNFVAVTGIGEKRLHILKKNIDFIKQEIKKLVSSGYVSVAKKEEDVQFSSNHFEGRVYTFTGFRDKIIELEIISHSGSISKSFSKKTTHLICLDKGTNSTKISKAIKEGKVVVSLEDFKKELEKLREQ